MKKFHLLFGALVILLVVAACSPSDEGSSTPESSEQNGDKKVIDFWHIDPGVREEVYMEAVARFEEKHSDVQVNVLQIPNDDYKQRMVVAMSGGNPPDVFHSWGGGWLEEFVQSGQVKNLNDEDIDFSQFAEVALDNSTYDGNVYGLPLGLSPYVFYYNKDIFAEHHLEVPETYDELLTIIDVLNENNVIPIALANQPKWPGAFFLMYLADRLAGENLFLEAYHREGRGFDDPAYVQAGVYIQELVERNAFNPGFNGISYDAGQGRQLMYSGQAAMMLMTSGFVNNMRDESPDFEEKMGVFNFPALSEGEGDPSNISAGASPVWSVSENAEHADLAVELVKELTSVETAQAFVDRTGTAVALLGIESSDPYVQTFMELIGEANSIQFPYDQVLPPALGELHKDTTQEILGLTMTPEEAAAQMESKAQEELE
ncbi:extracellular solute-binding protein [Alkalihalobacillus oceani]|uniref:Extracellular solute-binding protein n=1 Tax=Halalkalibacter oceani TaxID=1653776 RepID=A0A9X2DSJ6_9BACI|nr:extracellular solute-binding protein [Halalkalibacter oceani]MCM3714478.1 extracellular solute-binding protein [Halalkalibacter oceani]